MTSDRLATLAGDLRRASETRTPIAPLTAEHVDLTMADAYAIQLANVAAVVTGGRRVVGRKVGLTSKAMQDQLGVSEPDFGTLLDDMVVLDGGAVAVDRLLQPRVEAEIGMLLGTDLAGPGVTLHDALASISRVVPALEIIDSRIADWKITLADTIADNGSSGLVVLGTAPISPAGIDLRLVGVLVALNGEVVEHGLGYAALGHPAACLAWLANKLGEFGESLHAGDIVLPGSLHRSFDVSAGDTVTATFAGLGSVTVRFEGSTR